MKGYYVIGFPQDEPIEFTGKNAKERALKKANEIHSQGCEQVIVERFDDSGDDGYLGEQIIIKDKEKFEL